MTRTPAQEPPPLIPPSSEPAALSPTRLTAPSPAESHASSGEEAAPEFPFDHLPMPVRPYGGQAALYDSEYRLYTDDIPFYRARFEEYGVKNDVLELGSGTGRLTFPLAQAGYPVVGVDNSRLMLRRARARLKTERPEVAQRIHFLGRDATRLRLPAGLLRHPSQRFEAVIAPFSFLSILPEPEMRRQCLSRAHALLQPEGLLLLDLPRVRVPEPGAETTRLPERSPFASAPVYSFSLPPYGHIVDKYVSEHYDADHNVLQVRYFFVERDYLAETWFRRLEIRFRLAILSYESVCQLLQETGFRLIQVYGNYRGDALRSDSFRHIYECVRDA